jgi:hypothetical protein
MQRPSATISIRLDRERQLRLDLWAGFQAEQELAKLHNKRPDEVSILTDFSNDRLSMTHVLVLVYAALKHEDPDLTLEAVGHLVQLNDLYRVRDKVVEAWNANFVPETNGQTTEAASDPSPVSAGATSGATDAST